MITTQTIQGAEATTQPSATSTPSSGGNGDGGDEDAGVRPPALTWVFVALGALAMIFNIV